MTERGNQLLSDELALKGAPFIRAVYGSGRPPDRFVGRRADATRLRHLMGSHRAVTVVGPPGVGKTRLVIEVLSRPTLLRSWTGGVSVVELGEIAEPELVSWAIASALGVGGVSTRLLEGCVVATVRDRRLLLVLDDCERVLDTVGGLVQRLVDRCPALGVLCTSSGNLGLPLGATLNLKPLRLARPDHETRRQVAPLDAAALFLERARASRRELPVDGGPAAAVTRVCRQMDGSPLGIEVVAARSGVLTPQELCELLPPSCDAADAVAWSYRLLPKIEQVLLRRLSVFRGGCSLRSVESICCDDGLDQSEVLAGLSGLAAASLLVATTTGTQARYWLPAAVRKLAQQHLVEASEAQEFADRHVRFFTEMTESENLRAASPEHRRTPAEIDLEADNLRQAMRWATEGGPSGALRLGNALGTYWTDRRASADAWFWLAPVVGMPEQQKDGRWAGCLWSAGVAACRLGELGVARGLLEQCLTVGRTLNDQRVCGRALTELGLCLRGEGREADARSALEEGRALARQGGDLWYQARATTELARAWLSEGGIETGQTLLEEALSLADRAGDPQEVTTVLTELGSLASTQGGSFFAEAYFERAVAVARFHGLESVAAPALVGLGHLALDRGNYNAAERLIQEGLAGARFACATKVTVDGLYQLGRLAIARGSSELARTMLREARSLAEAGDFSGTVPIIIALAVIADSDGDRDRAEVLLDTAVGRARSHDNANDAGCALLAIGNAARTRGRLEEASTAFQESLTNFERAKRARGLVDVVEAIGGLAASKGSTLYAALLLGAAAKVRDTYCLDRSPAECPFYDSDMALIRKRLAADDLEATWCNGHSLSLGDAVASARRGPGPDADDGWGRLTRAERVVVDLVTDGMTNRQIGERLSVSPYTVQRHIAHVFAKLSINSRTVLAREATARNLGGVR